MKNDRDPMTLIAQADLVFLLARLLEPPDRHPPGDWPEVLELDELVQRSALATGPARLRRTVGWAAGTSAQDRAVEHNRLFEAGTACPPNETAYVRRDKGAILADIAGFYRAFGFDLAGASGEKHDHLVTELQFVALLLVMLARASERENADEERVTHQGLAAFAVDHLGAWLETFCERLAEVTTLDLYRELAETLVEVWAAIRCYHELPAIEPVVGIEVDAGTPYECGLCEAPTHPP